jgi:CheY-like chemotaxis protein
MIVEDHEALRELLARALESAGLSVSVADSADEAMRMLGTGSAIDMLLCDIRMPGCLDGLELCRWVQHRYPTVSILLQTAYSQAGTGTFHFIRKPFSPEQLIEALRDNLDDVRRQRWAAAQKYHS